MKGENRWIWFLLGRTLVHALLGGVTCATVGALVSSSCGALIGFVTFRSFTPHGYPSEGAMVGASLGAIGGGVLGLVVFAVLGLVTPAKARLIPPRLFVVRANLGMVIAAIIALTFYFSTCYGIACLRDQRFERVLSDNLWPIMFCGPTFMALGTIGGVLFGYRALKRRLLFSKSPCLTTPSLS